MSQHLSMYGFLTLQLRFKNSILRQLALKMVIKIVSYAIKSWICSKPRVLAGSSSNVVVFHSDFPIGCLNPHFGECLTINQSLCIGLYTFLLTYVYYTIGFSFPMIEHLRVSHFISLLETAVPVQPSRNLRHTVVCKCLTTFHPHNYDNQVTISILPFGRSIISRMSQRSSIRGCLTLQWRFKSSILVHLALKRTINIVSYAIKSNYQKFVQIFHVHLHLMVSHREHMSVPILILSSVSL